MRTFAVSDVVRAVDPLPTVDSRSALESLARGPVEASYVATAPLARAWLSEPVLRADGTWGSTEAAYHPFIAAVHAAFDQHRPLVLSPDAIWLMISQGFAQHVVANAEKLRSRMVAHEGRELIAVRRDDFVKGSPENPWPDVFTALSSQVATRTGDLHALVVADFSTTDATSRAASEIALLAAAQPYFAFQVHTMCGIPEITLTGTIDDWRSIATRARGLAAYDASEWIDALTPVLDELVATFEGRVDRAFWESFYKLKNASGGPYLTGWLNVLLPYVLDHQGKTKPNAWTTKWRDGIPGPFGGGPTTEALPSGLSSVPFLWKYFEHEYRMELLGGFAGVRQDVKTLALSPDIGWAVREAAR
jgi:hypothetical protein